MASFAFADTQARRPRTATSAPTLQRCGNHPCPPSGCRKPGSPQPEQQTAVRVAHVLGQPGKPLDLGVRTEFGQRYGHDFSRVRVHHDAAAAESAQALLARAYTFGTDIVFAHGEYKPGSTSGRRLLAHELAHVVQQSKAQ
jgi:hypothetical protein